MSSRRQIGAHDVESFLAVVPPAVASEVGEQRLTLLYHELLKTRKTRRMSVGLLKSSMEKLASYGIGHVRAAVDTYLECGYAGKGQDERYLIGIARGEAKRQALRVRPAPREHRPESGDGLPVAARHLAEVLVSLRVVYGFCDAEAREAVEGIGKSVTELKEAAEAGEVTAHEVDVAASALDTTLRAAVTDAELPRIAPYCTIFRSL